MPVLGIGSGVPAIVPPRCRDFDRVAGAEGGDRVAEAVGDSDVGFHRAAVAQSGDRAGEETTRADAAGADRHVGEGELRGGAVLTVIARPAAVEIEPSVAVMLAVSALLSVITPFFDEATAATPEVKVSAVAEPKEIAVPALLTTVGAAPLGLAVAPEKVRLWGPV